ncbi:MAG TPA: SGNH/GDSL hydrolase family protein [Rhizomicrobium sp.]|nr:SGNH/GDSL hydrolase family protein [Rhizomicrobium sp.]
MRIRQFALGVAFLLVSGAVAESATKAPPKDNWIGAWGFAVVPPPPGIAMPVTAPALVPLAPIPESPAAQPPLVENPGNIPVATLLSDPADVTIRQLVRVSAAGKRIRLRFTNEGGSDVLNLGAVHVGLAGPDGSVLPGSDRIVTFEGRRAIAIPAGAPLLSDAIDLPVKALDRLLISSYLPGPAARSGHSLLQYMAAGEQTGAPQLPGQRLARLTALVSEVDVDAVTATSVVVCLGDSITDGATSTGNAFRSYPDRLAERLAEGGKWAVVNVGIGGNKLLRYGTGPNALARLDRDVLSVPGVKAIILLEGINDIGRGLQTTGVQDPISLEALIAADKQIIQRAHDHGIKVIGATLTPYQGAAYASPAGEEVRTGLNNWIKTGGAFDGTADFAAATGDPANPLAFRAGFNIRDKLHPNDAGYKAMGDAVDLSQFK